MRPSLQRRLLALALGATLLVWVATVLFTWVDARDEIDELLDAHLAQAAALLIVQTSHEIEEIDIEHAPLLHPDARKVAFQIWENGRLRLHSVNAPSQPLAGREAGFSDRVVDRQRWRVFTSASGSGDFLIHVGERLDVRSALAEKLAKGLLLPLLLALPVLALVLWAAIRGGLRPLSSLTTAIAAREADNLAPIDDARAPREVVPLIDQLNHLFARIGQLFERERRFTADAAHELRTPVAAIKAQAQVARLAASAEARNRAIDQVGVGADRAARLVEQLLTLARLDAIDRSALQPHSLRALAAQVLADHAPAALSREVRLELVDGPETEVRCIPALVEVLLRNLIDNAVRHAGAGTVRVQVEHTPTHAVLSVKDQGRGIPEHERDKALERFYRVTGTAGGGTGLGLSIVQRIAEIHGATLRLGSGDAGKGLLVSVRFPRAG